MTITIHQALHGYSDGHRLLGSSLNLSSGDAKQVLIMSDVSGPGVASEGGSYLTGYPLPDSGLYALAKTWSAPEMPRPGCVWTHTLFIEFADLAALNFPSQIARLFQRPIIGSTGQFLNALKFDLEDSAYCPDIAGNELIWLAHVLKSLYGVPDEVVMVRRERLVDTDAAVLGVWDQQWPKLRRSFRFCTLTSRDRSNEHGYFDLQVTPAHVNGEKTVDLSGYGFPEWLGLLVADLAQPNHAGLRRALRVLGADTMGTRDAMAPLCQFQARLHNVLGLDGIDSILHSLQDSPLLIRSKFAKTEVAEIILSNLDEVSDEALLFLLKNLALVDRKELKAHVVSLTRTLWRRRPDLFYSSTQTGSLLPEVLFDEWMHMPVQEMLAELDGSQDFLLQLTELRPEILAESVFWEKTQLDPALILSERNTPYDPSIVAAMYKGLTDAQAIASAVTKLGSKRILTDLGSEICTEIASREFWFRSACSDLNGVAIYLSEASIFNRTFLESITYEVSPDAVPNDCGHDPWYLALAELKKRDPLSGRLMAYAFRRALGWRSRSVGELLCLSFEGLHIALQNPQFQEDEDWYLIEEKLAWAPIEDRWDRCSRLRQAVAETFVRQKLNVSIFAKVATDPDLFRLLMTSVLAQWGGYYYLYDLSNYLERESDGIAFGKRKLVRSFIRKNARIFW